MKQRSEELGAIATYWFKVMRDCGDDVRELLHDGHPTACIGDAAFAYVDAFKAHVNVGFFCGAELPDPNGLLEGTGKFMRHVKLRPRGKIQTEVLFSLINTAYTDLKEHLKEGSETKMWVCPNCGRSFKHPHQWHSCETSSIDNHLVDKTAKAAALFHAFHDVVLACGPPFEAVATKTMIVYRAARAFASIKIRNQWLDVELLLPVRHKDARVRDTPRQVGAGFAHRVRVAALSDLDRLLRGWICSACVYGQD